MSRYYAYCRVSKNDGTMTIENQTYAINEWAKEHNIEISATYEDECRGDTPIEKRAGMTALLKNLKEGDTVIVVEVFRLYRGFSGLQRVYETIIKDRKAEFVTLNPKEQLLCTRYGYEEDIMQQSIKSMTLLFMSLFSELERKNISERTKRALAKRRADHVVLGRPKLKIPDNFEELFKKASEGGRNYTHTQAMRELRGYSKENPMKKATYYKIAKDLGLSTSKGTVGGGK